MNGFVKMGRCLFFVLLLISSTVSKGQIYKYIGLEDGLNNQKIYHIQKDQRGYMWFLTQEGIDRYDQALQLFRRQYETGFTYCLKLALHGQRKCIMGNRSERSYFQVRFAT